MPQHPCITGAKGQQQGIITRFPFEEQHTPDLHWHAEAEAPFHSTEVFNSDDRLTFHTWLRIKPIR